MKVLKTAEQQQLILELTWKQQNMAPITQPQPFLSELMMRGESPSVSSRSLTAEQMPGLTDMEMQSPASPQKSSPYLLKSVEDLDFQVPIMKRGDSDGSRVSRLSSTEITSEMSSFGDSSMSSMLSLSRLYGREKEEKILRDKFDQIVHQKSPRQSSFVLISGESGSGKTRVGESLRDHVIGAGGYFCRGKFDQHQDDPFAPLCASFNAYVQQLLEEDENTIKAARRRILAAVEQDLSSLSKVIPPLRRLMHAELERMDSGKIVCEQCNQEKGRSMFALNKLMRAICSPDRPLVMLLDDIQWAPRCPLQKLRAMVIDDMNEGIMFVGISRNDVSSTSDVSNFLRELEERDNVDITNVSVGNLRKGDIEEMINDNLLMSDDQTKSLASFVFDHSGGNPFFAVETVRHLQQDSGLLQYDKFSKTWQCNEALCKRMTDYCPKKLMEQRLRSLPRDIQKVLMAASCLGSNITLRLLEVALQESVDERFQELVKKGKLVYNESRSVYSFRQNAFQSACYGLIQKELQPAFHLEIGLRLWKHLDQDELQANLFLVLNQLREGESLMLDQKIRYEVAAMCLGAAEKAASRFSFPTASSYLKFAFKLLGPDHWNESYGLSLILHNYAAEVEFAQGDSDRVDYLIDTVLTNARDDNDKLRAYLTQIYVLGVRGKQDDAIDIGLNCLRLLDVNITPKCRKMDLLLAAAAVKRRLRGKSNRRIKMSPHMQDSKSLAAMQILNMLFLNTYVSRQELFPFVVLKMMKLTLVHGTSAISSVAFAGYGALQCFSGRIEDGTRFGQLALELVDEWGAQSYQSRVKAFVWGSIFVHTRLATELLGQLKEGHRLGLQSGDTEFAMLNAYHHMMFMVNSGNFTCKRMIDEFNQFKDLTALHGHANHFNILEPFRVAFEKISDPSGDLTDHSEDFDRFLAAAISSKNRLALEVVINTKIYFFFVAGDYKSAIDLIAVRNFHSASKYRGSVFEVFSLLLDGLSFFSKARITNDVTSRKVLLRRARECMNHVKPLAKTNPEASLSKYILLQAENAASLDKMKLAEEKYDHAAGIASRYGSKMEIAFAKQAAGEFFATRIHDYERAIRCFEDACEAFQVWGAGAAVSNLVRRIDSLRKSN
mmetsp:Transcript_98987/g.285667  ORF Transcript_98987/g.285667 Transcript_98987/m.285667 type:complete len:1117 (+) Transcript_98987:75-3425(+)